MNTPPRTPSNQPPSPSENPSLTELKAIRALLEESNKEIKILRQNLPSFVALGIAVAALVAVFVYIVTVAL